MSTLHDWLLVYYKLIAAVLGSCLNLLPVRVQLVGSGSDEFVAALLCRIQDQHAASIEFKGLPLGIMAARCTS
jgi:hypothetical protein